MVTLRQGRGQQKALHTVIIRQLEGKALAAEIITHHRLVKHALQVLVRQGQLIAPGQLGKVGGGGNIVWGEILNLYDRSPRLK